jgi:hypothetical protein
MWSCLFLCICLSSWSIFYVWEKSCDLCLSEPGLLHLTWCPPISSIYLQIICWHNSLWLSKTPLYIFVYIVYNSIVYIYHIFRSRISLILFNYFFPYNSSLKLINWEFSSTSYYLVCFQYLIRQLPENLWGWLVCNITRIWRTWYLFQSSL